MALYAAPNCLSPQFATAAGDQFGWKSGLRSRCVPVTWLFNNFEYQFPDSSFKAGWRDAVCYESSCAPDGAPSRLGRRRGEGGCLFVFCALVSVVCCGRDDPVRSCFPPPQACSHFLSIYTLSSHTLLVRHPKPTQARCSSASSARRSPARPGPSSTSRARCPAASSRARSAPAPRPPPTRAGRSPARRRAPSAARARRAARAAATSCLRGRSASGG